MKAHRSIFCNGVFSFSQALEKRLILVYHTFMFSRF